MEVLENKNLKVAAISPMNAKDNFGAPSVDPCQIIESREFTTKIKKTTSYFVNNKLEINNFYVFIITNLFF